MKNENRKPKIEGNPNSEARIPAKRASREFLIGISVFEICSDFGFQTSDF